MAADRLSAEQERVVAASPDAGHLLVLAAPGSGKTRIIAARIGHLIGSGQAEPAQILAMTYTRRAAAVLADRVGHHHVWADTVHAVCADILHRHGAAIGWGPPVRIVQGQEQDALLLRAADAVGLTVERRGPLSLWGLREAVSRRKRSGLERGTPPGDDRQADVIAAVDGAYGALLDAAKRHDFDDLIARAVQVLSGDAVAARSYHRRLRFVFVDEFQDVSPEQEALVRLLAPPGMPGCQVLAVADPDQAIYGWLGAHAAVALDRFRRDYRPRTFRLGTNYRSTGAIVRAAAAVMEDQRATQAAAAHAADGLVVACLRTVDPEAEARCLTGLVAAATKTGRYGYGDVAVLYRTHARADVAERTLIAHDVPIWRAGPNRFFDQPEVQDGLRHLELLLALHDDCFEPALNWPRVLVDEVTMVHLRRLAAAAGCSLTELARRADEFADAISPLSRATLRSFLGAVNDDLAALVEQPIDAIVERLLDILGARRSPIPRQERETLKGVLEFLAGPLQSATGALREAIAAGRPVAIHHGGDVDGAAAAVILSHVLEHYLDHPVVLGAPGAETTPDAFVVALGVAGEVSVDGFGLSVRHTRSLSYSVSTQAWRVGQLVLMEYERLAAGRFVALDLETGTNHPNTTEIVEAAALPVVAFVPQADAFATLVRPSNPRAIGPDATDLHGLAWDDVRDAPPLGEVLPPLLDALGDDTLIGHFAAGFDLPILRRVAREHGLAAPANPLIDTWKMARRLLPDAAGHGLDDLTTHFGIAPPERHRALPDAALTARVFAALSTVQRAEQELDVLNEALPLVSLGIAGSGVPIADENETLVLAGVRAARSGHGTGLDESLLAAVGDKDRLATLIAERNARDAAVPEDDAAWDLLRSRWRAAVAGYRADAADVGLAAFLRYAALSTPIDDQPVSGGGEEGDPRAASVADRVTMMSIHAAKGKEWPLVFVLGAEDGTLPIWNSDDLDEERRVLYVAMTRAQQRLCLLWAAERDGRPRELSRFLRGLPPDLLEHRRQPGLDREQGAT